jgi:hypothetical protein
MSKYNFEEAMKKFKDCCEPTRVRRGPCHVDLSHGKGDDRDRVLLCLNCKAHVYKNKFFTGVEWEAWMEHKAKDTTFETLFEGEE